MGTGRRRAPQLHHSRRRTRDSDRVPAQIAPVRVEVFQNDWSLLKQRITGEAEERLPDLGVTFVRRSDVGHGSSWFVGGRGLSPAPRREADRGAFVTAPARPR